MPKDPQSVVTDYTYTQNRELSWLRFNRRVLEEGADETVPALERLKFIAIFASNLDEFFMVRVGSLVDMAAVSPEEVDSKSGMRPREQLKAVYEAVPGLIEIKGQLYNRVSGLLAQEGIVDLTYDQLTQEERAQVKDYFHSVVLPILSPQIVGQRHPTPHLDNKALYITALLRSKKRQDLPGLYPPSHLAAPAVSPAQHPGPLSPPWRPSSVSGPLPSLENTRWRRPASSAPPGTRTSPLTRKNLRTVRTISAC